MSRTPLSRILAASLFLLGCVIAYTQNQKQPPQLTLKQVKNDLYEIEGDGGNVAVYITDEGVILVDDKYEQDYDGIVSKVKSVTSQPIKYILSTPSRRSQRRQHEVCGGSRHHLDRERPEEHHRTQAAERAAGNGGRSDRVYAGDGCFLGGKEVRARFYGRGHTNGDAIIYFPALRTIHTGDLMAGNAPLIDYPGGGSVVEWTKTLDGAMNTLDFDTVIPGHGPVTTKAGLMTYRNNSRSYAIALPG